MKDSTTANRVNLTRASCCLLQTRVDFSRQDLAEEGLNLPKSSPTAKFSSAPLDVFAAAGLDHPLNYHKYVPLPCCIPLG